MSIHTEFKSARACNMIYTYTFKKEKQSCTNGSEQHDQIGFFWLMATC